MSKLVGFVAVLVLVLGGATAFAVTQTTNVQQGNTHVIDCMGGDSVVTKTSASDASVTCVATPTTTTTAPTTTTTTVAPTTTTTTTTQPPATTTTTSPPSGGPFPTASSTGVPAGTVLTSSGGIVANVDGQVINAKNISGGVRVSANNVTIQNSKITVGGGPSPVGVVIDAGRTGTRILDTEISAPGGFQGIQGAGGFLAQRVNIHGFEHGIEIRGAATVLDSYIVLTDFRYPDGTTPHFDAVAGWSVNNVVVRHNTLTAPPDQTGAINFTNDFGSITNVTIDNNLLTGGGYALYLRGDSSWYSPTAGKPVTGISVTNNWFGHSQWGYSSVVNAQVSFSGNVDNTTGSHILG